MNAVEKLRGTLETFRENGEISAVSFNILLDEIDRIKNEWMQLPKDKNGEVIHAGDMVRFENKSYEVEGTSDYGFILLSIVNGNYIYMRADACDLVKPEETDSIEDINSDIVEEAQGDYEPGQTKEKILKPCPICGNIPKIDSYKKDSEYYLWCGNEDHVVTTIDNYDTISETVDAWNHNQIMCSRVITETMLYSDDLAEN